MPGVDNLDDFFNSLPVPLYRSDVEGRLLAGNQALANLLGFASIEELRAEVHTVRDFYRDPAVRSTWLSAIESHGVVRELDIELLRLDGSSIWVRDTARVARDESGTVLYFEGALVDVSEKIRLQRLRDEFIATVSHELRNPIAVVLGLSGEMNDDYESFSGEERRKMIEMIARESAEAAWLIEDLLVAHHDDMSKLNLDPRPFAVYPEVEHIASVTGVIFEIDGPGDATVMADPGRTRQILRNLLSNARRYGGDVVRVVFETQPDTVLISICDNGGPIRPELIERIFEPFGQAGEKMQSGSVGIGLSVSRKLARLMGGDVSYRHDSNWSCFTVELPAG
jgi:PAS domain S-box-containing protein